MVYHRLLILFLIFAAGCQATSPDVTTPTPEAVTLMQQVTDVATRVPTANPAPSRTATIPPTPTLASTPTLTPTLTPTFTPTLTPTPTIALTPTLTLTPTSIASPTSGAPDAPTWTPPPADPAVQVADHYRLYRPIAQGSVNWVDRTYPYGGTSGGRLQVHHGVEFVNPRGTPILAAADGTVHYAGDDVAQVFGPRPNYYGNLVIIRHNFTSPEGQPVFTLYGHMDRIEVQTGQPVQRGDQVGIVGDKGIAIGPHLHFEVRVGDPNSFSATRNPELWIYPYQGYGTLAGLVTDASDNRLYEVTIQVETIVPTQYDPRYAFSYADDSVNSDPAFGENFTLGDLPANYYEVIVSENGRIRFQRIVYVYPNRTTWIDVQLN